MVIWWLESAAGSRQLPVLRIGIRSPARHPQTCALPQVAGALKLKRESVLFSTYRVSRLAAGARVRRHLTGPTLGIEGFPLSSTWLTTLHVRLVTVTVAFCLKEYFEPGAYRLVTELRTYIAYV